MRNPFIVILSVLILLILAAVGGYYFGFNSSLSQTSQNRTVTLSPPAAGLKLGPDSIMLNQQAQAQGTITKVESNTITLTGPDGKEANFKLASQFSISPLDPGKNPATQYNSTDIKLNQKTLIYLNFDQNDYVVKQIVYQEK